LANDADYTEEEFDAVVRMLTREGCAVLSDDGKNIALTEKGKAEAERIRHRDSGGRVH